MPVFYNALPQYLKNELVRIEKRALSIILPSLSYNSACSFLGITPIAEHHSLLCSRLFDEAVSNPHHKLNSLLPPSNNVKYKLRNHRPFALPRVKTNRMNNSFAYAMTPRICQKIGCYFKFVRRDVVFELDYY